jgi:hypothetical protein
MHHDALELPNGQIIFLTRLCEGQTARVIQLPAGQDPELAAANKITDTPVLAHSLT